MSSKSVARFDGWVCPKAVAGAIAGKSAKQNTTIVIRMKAVLRRACARN